MTSARPSLDRLKDEIKLRDAGHRPAPGRAARRGARDLERALAEARAQLGSLTAVATTAALTDEERQKKRETAEVLAAACTKCHLLKAGAFAPVRAARPVLTRAGSSTSRTSSRRTARSAIPAPKTSKVSKDLNFTGIQSCRECHKPFQARQDCRECHLFHPKAVP